MSSGFFVGELRRQRVHRWNGSKLNESNPDEERRIDLNLFYLSNHNPKPQIFKKTTQGLPIHRIDRGSTIACGFTAGVCSEIPAGYHKPFVGTSHHSAAKIADNTRTDGAFPTLALKKHMERDQVHTKNTNPINSTITGSPSDLHANEPALARISFEAEPVLPNAKTIAAMKEARLGGLAPFDAAADLKKFLRAAPNAPPMEGEELPGGWSR